MMQATKSAETCHRRGKPLMLFFDKMAIISGKSMNGGRWKQIEEVYHSALASPLERCAALLDELCSGDPDMRREVESLLEAREQAGSFLSASHLQDHIAQLAPE